MPCPPFRTGDRPHGRMPPETTRRGYLAPLWRRWRGRPCRPPRWTRRSTRRLPVVHLSPTSCFSLVRRDIILINTRIKVKSVPVSRPGRGRNRNEELDAMTITQTEAFDAILQHHRTLDEHVGVRIAALVGAVEGGIAYEPAVAALVAYLAEEVLPHALAEEHSLYRVAGSRAVLADTVNEMTAEHRVLTSATESLANAATAPAALEHATQIGTLFTTHVNKENDLLLPVLLEDDDVDLAQLLVQMHRLTEAAQEAPFVEDASSPDSEAVVVSLLLEAANELANAGHGDRACRLVASAWAALRTPRPALAVRTTASLHRLVRLVTSEPVAFHTPEKGSDAGDVRQLDVRHLAPAQRHETIFAAYHGLAPETGYVLVNDHDPKPLRY